MPEQEGHKRRTLGEDGFSPPPRADYVEFGLASCFSFLRAASDAVDLVISAIEKFQSNYDLAAKLIKDSMDKKYNENWIVVIGSQCYTERFNCEEKIFNRGFCSRWILSRHKG